MVSEALKCIIVEDWFQGELFSSTLISGVWKMKPSGMQQAGLLAVLQHELIKMIYQQKLHPSFEANQIY